MIRDRPHSSLFPYTTLFRSRGYALLYCDVLAERAARRRLDPTVAQSLQRDGAAGGDRKSTRLNSSHVSISYSVFCLKKKNQHTVSATETSRTTHGTNTFSLR